MSEGDGDGNHKLDKGGIIKGQFPWSQIKLPIENSNCRLLESLVSGHGLGSQVSRVGSSQALRLDFA